ncbi:MAG: YmdB family metallophosphoesterase, partial [Actinomycetia bacterium]|nr:YmdB family metallophosphoesterase [Actinomycetes bacterium]
VGMVGPGDSVIGVKKENIIERFLKVMPQKFTVAEDDYMINAVVIDVDERIGKANDIRRINYVATK